MKILLVTEFFPPKNAVASLRLYSFAKYWRRAGHEITILTTIKNKKNNDLNLDIGAFTVIKVPIPFFSRLISSAPDSESAFHKNNFSFLGILSMLYRHIQYKTGCFGNRFPHLMDLWAKKAIKSIDANNYDIVLSSGGPYSVHRVGLTLKKKNQKLKWIVDWRDLWTKDLAKGFWAFWPYEKLLEKKFHRNADLITTISDPLNETLKEMAPFKSIVTIFNGFDPDDFAIIQKKEREKSAIFSIVFTGSFYAQYQDPSPLFAAIAQIKMKDNILFNRIKIIFSGKTSDVYDIAKKHNISEAYHYLGFIKREEALKLQYNASAALYMDFKKTDGILPGKLFEYINISRKIIAIGGNESSSAIELIKKTNSGIFLGNDSDSIAKYLISCLNNTETESCQKNESIINEFSRENQANKLLNYILNQE